jgi:hypothetical protein
VICKHCQHYNPESNRFCGMCGQAMAPPQATTTTTPASPSQTSTLGLRPTIPAVSSGPPFSSKAQPASAVNGDKKVQFPPVTAPPQTSNSATSGAPVLFGHIGQPPAAPDDIETVVRVSPHPVQTQPLTPAATQKKPQMPPSPAGPQTSAPVDDRRPAERPGPVLRAPLGPQPPISGAVEINGARKAQPPSTQPLSSFAAQTPSPANSERKVQNSLSNPPGAQAQSAAPASSQKTSAGFERLGSPENAASKLAPQNTAPKLMTGTQPLPLPAQRRPAAQASSPRRVQPSAPIRLSGPSFLGLSDDPSEEPEKNYDDLYKTNWGGRLFVVFIVLAIAGGLVYMQWRSSHPLQTSPSDHTTPAAAANPQASAGQQQPAAEAEAKSNEAKSNSETTGNTAASAAPSSKNSAAPGQQQKIDLGPAAVPAGAKAPDSAPASQPPVSQSKTTSKSAASPSTITEGHEVVSSKFEGDQEQPVRLAENYIQGRGVPRNCDEALGILRTASNQGNARAEIKLGALYATGNCVSMDRVEAYHHFSRAMRTQPNNAWLDQSRSMLWSNMDASERKQAMEVEK